MPEPHQYIITFDKHSSMPLDSISFQSKVDAIGYILNNGYNLPKVKITEEDNCTYYNVGKPLDDWTVIKSHQHKMKEIPGYAKKWYEENPVVQYDPNYHQKKHIEAKVKSPYYEPQDSDEKNFDFNKAASAWVKSLDGSPYVGPPLIHFKGTQEEFKSNTDANELKGTQEFKKLFKGLSDDGKKKKIVFNKNYDKKYPKEGMSYYIYNKGKLGQKVVLKDLEELSDWVMEKQAFIMGIEKKRENVFYVLICYKEDIAQFLPEKIIEKRFEEIVNRRGQAKGDSDYDPYKHLEI